MIVDDHEVLSQSLAVALRAAGIEATVATDLRREGLLAEVSSDRPDLILLDLDLGAHGSGNDLIEALAGAGAAVVLLTASDDRQAVATALARGAAAYIHKSAPFDRLAATLRDVADGRGMGSTERRELLDELDRRARQLHPLASRFERLTAKEREVLGRLMAGSSPAEIAASQFVAVSTVRSQQKSIYRKLGVNSQLAAVALARRAGWSPPD